MKRLFVTTKLAQAKALYFGVEETIKTKLETDFSALATGKEYDYGDNFRVIVLEDSFKDWTRYQIDPANDYILYHLSSQPEVIKKICDTFVAKHIQSGSHVDHQFHDKVYRIIFDDDNPKPNRFLEALGFTKGQIEEKDTFESKLDFLHNCLTPDGMTSAEVTQSEWARFDEFTKLKATKDGPFGRNYIDALSELRDKLLDS